MFRYLRYAFMALLGLSLIIVALANRDAVLLRLLPQEISEFAGVSFTVELPLFVVVFGGIIAGLLIGFVWEWLREARHRAAATRAQREAKSLEREVKRLKSDNGEEEDDVLALLNGTGDKAA